MQHIFGYARVSATNRNLATQLDDLTRAGCTRIFQEKVSGSRISSPALNELLADSACGRVQPPQRALSGPRPGHRFAHASRQDDYWGIFLFQSVRAGEQPREELSRYRPGQAAKQAPRLAGRARCREAKALEKGLSVAEIGR
ncbi:hypothetical protein GO988_23025 [Hymenobacter sp. HMF4947]|uniref:Resolvase/invertase-type recombinase catalytic domain-containing protein n=1 Tax=Hymenobacter ginkgonis TaxID=2682976 RepID=A0A7K1TLD9_9BACT|nr:hypothetical protein [Hymenobacter ginkgonis]